MTTTTYIASRFRNKPLVREVGEQLFLRLGWVCLHSWTEETPNTTMVENATRDLREIKASQVLVILTKECESVPGGMHFEAGVAYALGHRVIVIGPAVNIFYLLPSIERFDTLDEFFAAQ